MPPRKRRYSLRWTFERTLRPEGVAVIAGVDEVGRGCWAGPVFAQSCAMCYSTARAVTKAGQQAITRGVVVLLVPPLGFMTVGVGLALRYGKKRDKELE